MTAPNAPAHLSWATLNDLVDHQLPAAELAAAEAHVAACDTCRAQWQSLRSLGEAAAGVPDTAVPPPEAWPAIRQAISDRKLLAFPDAPDVTDIPTRNRVIHASRTQLAAAALVLVTISSTITAVVLRAPDGTAVRRDSGGTAVTAVAAGAAPAGEVAQLEQEFLATAATLREALDRERTSLSPSTIATVERNLTIIDDAIAEARAALLADPANAALRELLRRSHQQKIDFLRRTTTLLEQA